MTRSSHSFFFKQHMLNDLSYNMISYVPPDQDTTIDFSGSKSSLQIVNLDLYLIRESHVMLLTSFFIFDVFLSDILSIGVEISESGFYIPIIKVYSMFSCWRQLDMKPTSLGPISITGFFLQKLVLFVNTKNKIGIFKERDFMTLGYFINV